MQQMKLKKAASKRNMLRSGKIDQRRSSLEDSRSPKLPVPGTEEDWRYEYNEVPGIGVVSYGMR